MAMVRQLSPNSIASRSPSRVPHREPQTTCGQKTLILYTASGYIDQQTKKFAKRVVDWIRLRAVEYGLREVE